MKILADMNLSPRWAQFLIDCGIEAEHWSALGRADASDSEIMQFARTNDRVVLTHDLDFGSILAVTQGKSPSVIQLRANDLRIEAIGAKVIAGIRQSEADLEQGALLTLDADRIRLRLLPFGGDE